MMNYNIWFARSTYLEFHIQTTLDIAPNLSRSVSRTFVRDVDCALYAKTNRVKVCGKNCPKWMLNCGSITRSYYKVLTKIPAPTYNLAPAAPTLPAALQVFRLWV